MTDADRRSQLLGLKLGALVRDHDPSPADVVPGVWPGGAALTRGGEAWVLAESDVERAIGRGLAWARQQGSRHLHVLAERATGVLARKAGYFASPPSVWHVDGRVLIEAVPEPFPEVDPIPGDLAAFRSLILDGGAEPIEEHGVLAGEVVGLEVCRAVRDPDSGAGRLAVGVGAHDREAFQLLHGDVPSVEALRRVAEVVSEHRRVGAEPHPLNRLGAERAMRARLIADPSLVGADRLEPAEPPVPRRNLKDPVPCVARGERDGHPVVVVCSTGVDLDLIPYAADARAVLGDPTVSLLVVVPARDAVPVTLALAALLAEPATVIGL